MPANATAPRVLTSLLIIATLVLTTTASAFTATSADQKAITRIITDDYPRAINASDAKAYAAMFTEDGARMPPGRKIENSRATIEKTIENLFGKVTIDVVIKVLEIEVFDDMATVIGSVEGTRVIKKSGDRGPQNVRSLFVMKKVADRWLIHRLMWNKLPA